MTWYEVSVGTSEARSSLDATAGEAWRIAVDLVTEHPKVVAAVLREYANLIDPYVPDGLPADLGRSVAEEVRRLNDVIDSQRDDIAAFEHEVKVARDEAWAARDEAAVAAIRRDEAQRALRAAGVTGGKAPGGPPSATQSAELPQVYTLVPSEPQRGSQDVEDTDGDPNVTIASRVADIVDAARAWARGREMAEAMPRAQAIIDAVTALRGSYSVINANVIFASYRDKGWRAGVRWAAAEADAQARAHDASVVDYTDHLRLCADNWHRPTLIGRDQAPDEYLKED